MLGVVGRGALRQEVGGRCFIENPRQKGGALPGEGGEGARGLEGVCGDSLRWAKTRVLKTDTRVSKRTF